MRRVEVPRQLVASAGAIPLALGGMLGAGVFVGLAPAADVAGGWLLLGIPVAALTAACCALAVTHQSATYRGPGAAYACVRSELGVVPGRIAASTGLVGHIAAVAALAGAVGRYLPSPTAATAVVAILLTVLASTAGLHIRSGAAWLWLVLTVAVLAVVVAACLTIAPVTTGHSGTSNPLGITAAAGTMFFGFLGFERLAAPAEERDRHDRGPLRGGLVVALTAATVVTLVVGVAALRQLGAARLSLSPTPLTDALRAAAAPGLTPLVGVGAALAMLPVLLGALESLRSTALAVVADGDLPAALGRTGGRGTPYLLDLAAGLAAAGLSVLIDPASAITLAACCLLVHYAFANAGARILLIEGRTWAMRAACLGMGLSVVLAMSMPVPAMLATLLVAVVGPVLMGALSRRWR